MPVRLYWVDAETGEMWPKLAGFELNEADLMEYAMYDDIENIQRPGVVIGSVE